MIAELKAGDGRWKNTRPVLVLSGTRDEVADLEICVATALDGGERGTEGAHAEFEGLYIAVTIKEKS